MAITKLMYIGPSTGKNVAAHLKNAIKYICDPKKTEGGIYIVGNAGVTAEGIYQSMIWNKELWGKTDQRQGYHYVLSFPPDCRIDEETVLKIAEEFTGELLRGEYLYTIAVHNDKNHLHAHIIFDSVSMKDGYKFHSPAKDWQNRIQPITDRLCEKYHLPTLSYEEDRKGKNYHEWKHEQDKCRGNSDEITPYDVIRDDIDEAILRSDTYPEFLDYLKTKLHYHITRNKSGLSLQPHWRGKAVRTSRLGRGYAKEDIVQRISNKTYEPEIEKHYRQYGDMKEIRDILLYKSVKNRRFRMTPFQRQFVQRYYRTINIRNPVYDQTWRYKGDVLKSKKISRCTVRMLKYDINSLEDIQKRKREFTAAKNAAELEIRALQTRLYRSAPTSSVATYKKLQDEYVRHPSEKMKAEMEKQMGQITENMTYEEALSEYDAIRAEIKRLRDAVRSCRFESKVMDEIQALFFEPEHSEPTIISGVAKEKDKQTCGRMASGRSKE